MHILEIKLDDFDAAHRVVGDYQGPCRNLHGHTYMLEVSISSNRLDSHGFVIDFSKVKQICNSWIKDNFDHAVLVSGIDVSLMDFVKNEQQKHYMIDSVKNTTAEVLSMVIFNKFNELLADYAHISLDIVKLYESESSCAIYQKT